jgi:decaprenylphospho-beta-D-ribofuranose 2-oxidase
LGLTGVILEATLQLLRVETAWVRVDTLRTTNLDETMSRMADSDVHHHYAVAWLDFAPDSSRYGAGVLTNADHVAKHDLPAGLRQRAPVQRQPLTVPDLIPSGLLRRRAIRVLNAAWYELNRAGVSHQPLNKYFFPLDRLAEWNRAYGNRGFLQYQIVAPDAETVRRIADRLHTGRCPVTLAVLKRFGPQEGYLAFPMPGWTLAVDVPVDTDDLPRLLDECDELLASTGGRVYLAKDSRVRPEIFRAMYPRLDEWRDIRDRLDVRGRMRSDLARRLELVR